MQIAIEVIRHKPPNTLKNAHLAAKKALVSLRCDYFHTSALFGGHSFYKSCIEILKYRAVVAIVSVAYSNEYSLEWLGHVPDGDFWW